MNIHDTGRTVTLRAAAWTSASWATMRHKTAARRDEGFSILEMALVLFIMGILAATGFFVFQMFASETTRIIHEDEAW